MAIAHQPDNSKNVEFIYPLSPLQQGMLFHTLYDSKSRMYFQQLTCSLDGHLNVSAFEQAWTKVVERHTVLRTVFVWEKRNKPLQIVCKSVNLPWTHYDWRLLSPVEQQDHLEAFLQLDRDQGFELNQAPLMRYTIIHKANNQYQFIWSYHHILIDGWSLPNIFQEVFTFYNALIENDNLYLKTPRPYRDYITWLQKQDTSKAEIFWQQQLKDFTAPTPLIVDKPLTNQERHPSYNKQEIYLSEQTTAALNSFARQHQLTLNNLVQGAYGLLLSRYSGEADVVFGATVSGRPPALAGVESMVGLFINTLPVRVSITDDTELLPWLKNLQVQQLECEQYSYSPLVDIHSWSEVPRGLPLFESIVVFENYPLNASLQQQIANLDVFDIQSIERTNYPLTVIVVPGSQLSLNINYDTSRFDYDAITRMLGHFQTLLEGIVTHSKQPISQLPLLTASEQKQLLFEWNNTDRDYSQNLCIHQLFEAQVELTPDAVAIVFEDQQLTYQQLNARVNQLAHHLQILGVKPDVLVGLCVERSLEMIVGLLGILKAGGAYVPLDPDYPQERLNFILADSQIQILLTQQQLLENLPKHNAQIFCLDTDWEKITQHNLQNPTNLTTGDNLAYIIYTSGSTGKPKGVLINHANIVRLFAATEEWFQFNNQDVWTLFHSFAFDFSVWEIWGALIKGGRLVIVPYWVSRSPTDFYHLLCQEQVTVLNQTPSAFRQLIWAEEAEERNQDNPLPLSLRWIIFGGEALEIHSLKPWFSRHGDEIPKLVNMYGITETTVHVTYRPITTADLSNNAGSVIGCPIPDLQVYVLDKKRQLLPIGVIGEMYVGGAGLARGYLNRQELTSQVFIAHPFNDDPNARFYKTGDLARYLSNGDLEYLGRIDNQVKIRGFRIELGEIEIAISQHPDVQATVVIAREDIPGDKRLVAYLVLNQHQEISVNALRQFLDSKLPNYMIPSAFVFLEILPLTSNGKVDRRALPVPESHWELEIGFVAPRTPTEEVLANIWAEVLGVEKVGIDDNFFELGGDSILSLQIIARANQAGLHLSPKQLFEHQTVAQLATVVGTARKIQAQQGLVTGIVPLTPIQHWFFLQNQPEPHHYNQAILLWVPSNLKSELLKRVLQQLLLHHDALRLQFTLENQIWQQINADFGQTVPLRVVDLSAMSPDEQLAALEKVGNEVQASFNLAIGSLIRATLFELGNQANRLLLTIHHLAVDGVSWRILLDDLQTGYQQLSRGEVMQLPLKTTSFQYWAQRLSEYAQSDTLSTELAYWLNASHKQVFPIPVDYEQGVNTAASTNTVSVSLDAIETQSLLQEVPRAYNTQINDVLLTALVQVVSKWTGSNSLLLDLEGHGREDLFADVDLSRTVGWFTTIFPVLLELEATENLGKILKSVKEQLRQIPHKGIGYGVLRYLCLNEEITDKLQTSTSPQISFNYLGQFDQALSETADFQLTTESAGAVQSLNHRRSHLLDINGVIANGQLQIDWSYSSNIYQHATIKNLAQEFIQTLRTLIAHCLSLDAGGYTPSDFPLAKLTQAEIDTQLSKIQYQNLVDIYPLSHTQQGMLFHSVYAPESGVYFEQLSCTLKGKMEVQNFEQAWQQVIARHSVFRTAFVWENYHQPLQIVYSQVQLPLEISDWLLLSADEQQNQLDIFLKSEQRRGFELSQAPLMRLNLIQLDADIYQFVWSHHHLLLDGWSLSLVLKEVFDCYAALCQGKNFRFEPTVGYRNYIVWLQQQDLAQAKAFWQQKLQGFTAATPFTVDKPLASREQQSDYSEQEVHLSESVTATLQAFAKKHQLTLNNLVQGAWSILLSRYSGEADVVFGVTVSGRPPALMGVESMVGLFINTLPVRVNVSPDEELLACLKDLQAQQIECDQYSYTPLVDVQGWSEVPRGLPLFESIVVFENYPIDASLRQQQRRYLDVFDVQATLEITDYPITVTSIPGSQLSLNINYDTSRFDYDAITRMLGHFQTLLEGIVTHSKQPISQLPLLTASEQKQLLFEWNNTDRDYSQNLCIHQLFEAQVELTPDAVAIVFEDQQLTYQQLNARVNQLAHHLQILGVKPDVLVGLCVERSLEMIVGLLGILKAGGAYVPLDPDYPQERLNFILADSQIQILLTQQQLLENLPKHNAQIFCLDTDWEKITQHNLQNPTNLTTGDNLAYIIYTSGSTGKPKGVLINHANIVRLFAATEEWFQFNNQDVWTLFHSFAFDFSVWEIWGALIKGGRLVIVPYWVSRSPTDFYHLLCQEQVTVLNQTPSAFRQLIWAEEAEERNQDNPLPLSLRWIIFGGEALEIHSLKPWFSRHGDEIPKLVNMYGITETTVHVTYRPITTADLSNNAGSVIGCPIPDLQVYVLDKKRQLLPIGVIGEMYVGGAGLARGYLNRQELTSQVFIAHPFNDDPNARFYKTGDLARYLSNGDLEYLGRIDNQVKIRGFRIELGEIEIAISQHPDVQATVVIAREDIPGDKRLVAYLVLNQHQEISVNALRQFLDSKLPNYMIPSAFVFLEILPLTSNGKVDRRALPVPESHWELEIGFVAPRTPTEEVLANIWAEVLGVEKVGIDDNFFELGGDSILSLQIIARANQAGLHLSPKQLFEHQTVAQLATVVGTARKIQAQQGLVTGIVPLTPIQHWFFLQNQPEPHHYNQAILLWVPSNLKSELLKRVLQQLLLHHDALRLQFTLENQIWQQINADFGQTVPLRVVDLSAMSPDEQLAALEKVGNEVQASFNLAIGSLIRATLFELGNQANRLLLTIHHLAVDGVSWRILLDDLQTGYQQLSRGEVMQLPLKTTSFQYWAQRLSEYAQSDTLSTELAYWLNASHKQVFPIPVDYEQGVNTAASTNTVSVSLDAIETQSLLQEVPRAYNTQINDVLLTALVQVVSKWTGSNSLLLNLEGHGREDLFADVDLSRTVGWFTTIFPVLLELEATENLGKILKSVKEQLRQIPHKGIGYGVLRYLCLNEEITDKLQTSTSPQISFNYLGQFDQALSETADFQLTTESAGAVQSLNHRRSHLLDINGVIANGQLQIDWSYSSNIYQHATIKNLAQEFIQTLRTLIAHCLSLDAGGYTPSDFPLAKLTQAEIDTQLSKIQYQNLVDIYPLSHTQQGMLFHSVYAPESGVYFEQLSCTLKGKMEVQNFEQAWQQVIARHSVFRTAFVWENYHQPLQIVYSQVQLPLEISDWLLLSADEQQNQLDIFLKSEQRRGFELSQAPLMRLNLIQLDADIYQFVWSHHHLLLDGWSLSLVLKEVFDCYAALCQGKNFRFEPTVGYRNYIVWLQQQDLAQAKAFWQQKLQGFTAATPFTVDKPLASREQQSDYSEQEVHLSESVTATLQAFAKKHQLTLNNLVQGAWSILLSRYSGEADVVFGVTVSGRPPALMGVESMVGLFINTLPVRVNVSPDEELLACLKDLQAQQIECDQYSYTPLVDVQGWSEVPRGLPLFESIVVFENYPIDASLRQQQRRYLDVFDVQATLEITDYPITVTSIPGSQLSLNINYDTSRFDYDAITRMLGHFQTLLEGIVTHSKQPISQLPLLTASEQKQLLFEWNNTDRDYSQNLCIHQLFEAQVELTPDAVAIVFEDQQLTYQQLNARVNQLAHHLQILGVKPDVLVGLCVERSLEMIVGLLGILKAGGAYVPLDPDYPQERLSYMLLDCQVSVLLTQRKLIEQLPQHQAKTVCLDSDWKLITRSSSINVVNHTTPENLVYVIYTSGSTGQPKGVMVTHQNLVNAYLAWEDAYQLRSLCTSHLQMASFSFDVFSGDVVRALCSGGKLVICPRELLLEPEKLYGLMQIQQIDCAEFVPAVLRNLILYLERTEQNLSFMKLLIVGSDSWSTREYQQFRHFLGNETRLINSYGVTEATIDSSYFETAAVNLFNNGLVPIGRPFANTQIYILDQYKKPLPIGIPGELYIGGAGVSQGYLNRPDLTQEKFIPNPFSQQEGGRFYKTGDIVKYLSDGNIEYLERSDHQVKIRGFRIELGDIEAVLSQYPEVQTTVVIVREDVPGDKRLVAYVVVKQEPAPTINELRQFLSSKLPHYMIPGAFVILETLPLTPNGKIDRRALPLPDSRPELEVNFVAATTSIEKQLASIWAEVLRVEEIGIHDNFFELGGDSILSLQIIARTNQAGLQLSPKQLFEHPTIAQLATVTGTTKKIPAQQTLVTGLVPLTPIQHWFFAQNQPEPHHYNQSVVLSVPQHLNPELLNRVLQELLRHHDALRMQFVPKGETWQQINAAFEENLALSVVDLSHISLAEQATALENAGNQFQASLNLSTGPLIRVVLFALGDRQPSRLLVIIHHLVVDGVSWRILLDDLQTAYQQLSLGEAIRLPAKTTSFQYWAQRLSEYAQSTALVNELNYWLTESAANVNPLPVDYLPSQITNTIASSAYVSLSLNKEETRTLLQEVPAVYNTQINDVLLTALVQSFAQWTGSDSLLVDLEGHGREELLEDIDLSRTVGWFTTFFPIHLQLRNEKHPGNALKLVKEQLRKLPMQGIGYGVLRYLSQYAEKLKDSSPAEVSFNYLGQLDRESSATATWAFTQESGGTEYDTQQYRSYLLELNALVMNSEMQINWEYSEKVYHRTTVERLAEWFMEALRTLIQHCQSPNVGGFTPSDFPKAGLNQEELDDLLADIN